VFDNKKCNPQKDGKCRSCWGTCFEDNGDIRDMMYPNMGEKEWQV